MEIVRRSDTAKGFELLPRRLAVERTLAWLNRNRRLVKDFEATIESTKTWMMIASVKLMIRKMVKQVSTYWIMSRILRFIKKTITMQNFAI